jgi:hypothetical protein
LRVLCRVDEAAARALAEKLRAVGAVVAVEASPPEFAMPSDISLMSLDGGEEPPPLVERSEPSAPAPPVEPSAPPPPIERSAPPPPSRRPLSDEAFTAPPIEQAVMELERPAPAKRSPEPPPDDLRPHAAPVEEEEVEDEWRPIPGRLMQGKLRQNPMARLGGGIVLGLLLGYLLATPYADRAERRVAELRAAANVDRYRPVEEARANAARLDTEADDLASGAFIRMSLIWLGTAGIAVAGWYRLT